MHVIDAPANAGAGWIRQAGKMFFAQPARWISLLSCWALFSLAILLIIPIIGPALMIMLQPGLFAGFVIAARDQDAGKIVTLTQLFAGFRFNGRALISLGSISLLARVAVALLLSYLDFPSMTLDTNGVPDVRGYVAGFDGKVWILLVGVVLSMLIEAVLWFAVPLLALKPMSASDAVRWSFYAFISNFVPMLVLCVLMAGIFFLASVTLFLGLIVAMPIYALIHYTSYQQVFPPD